MILSDKYHDSHYAEMEIQPLEVMQVLMSKDEFQYFLYGQIVKYQMRAGKKCGESYLKDITKRDRYIQWYYMSLVLKKYINPNDAGDDVPLEFRMETIETIDKKIWELRKTKQIIKGVK